MYLKTRQGNRPFPFNLISFLNPSHCKDPTLHSQKFSPLTQKFSPLTQKYYPPTISSPLWPSDPPN